MLRLYLIAHAPTAAQRLARFPADEEIAPVDQRPAARLMAEIGRCDQVWRGPERRCAETATALGLAASPSEDLRAWSAGAWAGREIAWVAEHDPAGFLAWRTDPDAAPIGGESLTALIERVRGWMQAQERANGRIQIIADAAVVRAALLYVLDADARSFWRVDVAPLSLAIVQYTHGEWRLRRLDNANPD